MVPWSVEWKQERLFELHEEWEACQNCVLNETRNHVVFGGGNPDADIMLIGETPGVDEDKTGTPFVGKAGELLRQMISNVGLEWDDLYVTNIIACRPPKGRDPLRDEKVQCLPRLHEIIYLVDPLLILAVGKYAHNSLVGGRTWGIEAEQGRMFSSPGPRFRISGERNGAEIPGRVFPMKSSDKDVYRVEYDVVPILHPAYILRVDSFDTRNNTFDEGSLFYKVMDTLDEVVKLVRKLKANSRTMQRMVERM
jgi:DNA polymerase